MAEELKYQSEHTGQQIDQAIDNYVAMTQAVQTAENSATAASASATAAAQSAADAQAVTQGQKGYFETDTALKAAHPTGQVGWWAIVGSTDTIWVWDDTTRAWLNSGNQTDLSNYYTKTQADAEFPAGTIVLESEDPTLVPLNADTLGGQASNYYCKAADVGDAATLTTTAKTVVSAVNELNQNLTPVLLWTNPAPTAGFGPQTVSIDLSRFSRVRIYGGERTSPINLMLGGRLYFEADMGDYSCMIFGQSGLTSRALKITTSGIAFGDGQYLVIQNGALAAIVNNSLAIPLKIYGIK